MLRRIKTWWYYNSDWVLFIAGSTAVFGLLCIIIYAMSAHSCKEMSAAMGFPGKYGFYTGCMVDTPAGTLPIKSVRYTID